MKLIIVRHGDPDYEIDSVTEKGKREVEALAERLAKIDVTNYYVSPLGRAKDTAKPTLEAVGRTAVEKEWLREFAPTIQRPDVTEKRKNAWDWLPADWQSRPVFYDKDHWFDDPVMAEGHVKEEYQWVCAGLDEVLAEHGYVREGEHYRVERSNHDTLMFFCHFGLECVLLSHLIGVPPMVLWHGFCAAPSSVTTIYTEERRAGVASWRISAFGDISHLYVKDEPPAFAARFSECYADEEGRLD